LFFLFHSVLFFSLLPFVSSFPFSFLFVVNSLDLQLHSIFLFVSSFDFIGVERAFGGGQRALLGGRPPPGSSVPPGMRFPRGGGTHWSR
jgi:hypothetical protein